MPRHWIAYRLDLDPPFESFLVGSLWNWLHRERGEGVLGRWFFLRYLDNGLHLRLRMQPARNVLAERLAADFVDFANRAEPAVRVTTQTYDRDTLAFGETRESVLAELLHVATSDIALRLLRGDGNGSANVRRWLPTAAATAVLLRHSVAASQLEHALAEWSAFADRTAGKMGLSTRTSGPAQRERQLSVLRAVEARMAAALERDDGARRAIALLARVRNYGARGAFVATHALHFFCNEMGLRMDEEGDMVECLRTLFAREENNADDATMAARQMRQTA
ncbi:MAG TPA: thiopeptide-type bacteriocin biosynthesis protein [Gammaproteobacteria bacterium]|nr:thiopeptide-type bacteriocin biosynthesis protein [Gammaproteobacteria bacterium]